LTVTELAQRWQVSVLDVWRLLKDESIASLLQEELVDLKTLGIYDPEGDLLGVRGCDCYTDLFSLSRHIWPFEQKNPDYYEAARQTYEEAREAWEAEHKNRGEPVDLMKRPRPIPPLKKAHKVEPSNATSLRVEAANEARGQRVKDRWKTQLETAARAAIWSVLEHLKEGKKTSKNDRQKWIASEKLPPLGDDAERALQKALREGYPDCMK
jgi:hypothetical protein